MRIKLGELFSSSHNTPGGAPQGTKAGNFLFCASVDGIEREDYLDRVMPEHQTNDLNGTMIQPPLTAPDQPNGIPTPELPEIDLNETISRYGLPESVSDSFGLRDLHKRLTQDFQDDNSETLPVTRDASSDSVSFLGDARKNRRHQRIEDSDSDTENNPTQTDLVNACLLYTSPSPRDRQKSRMPSSA